MVRTKLVERVCAWYGAKRVLTEHSHKWYSIARWWEREARVRRNERTMVSYSIVEADDGKGKEKRED